MDKFSILKRRAEKALKKYEEFREALNITEPMLSETIRRESRPFVKGHFTLAVLGEMSAGKSTFINALLGQRGLLPSAHGQTTCVLTEIVDSEDESIEVTFADGNTKKVDSKIFQNLVAVPKDFENLPINEVNRLIVKGLSFQQICARKDTLKELQSGMEIDETLLNRYCSTHNKSNIPEKVFVKHHLPEAFKGWRIVDTPGVGSIGGIENTTKDFINSKDDNGYNNVDAIIFVNSGRLQMQRSGFNRFVEDTFDTIYEEARRRMFLVISWAADPAFIEHEKEEVSRAKNLFINKYHLKEERLVCVDSICSLFFEYVVGKEFDLKSLKKKEVPTDWSENDWKAAIDTRDVFKNMLDEDDEEVNNQNLIKYFNEYSGINEIRDKLNDFAEGEKGKVFQKLMDDISKDMCALRELKKKAEEIQSKKMDSTKEEFGKKMGIEKEKLDELKKRKDEVLQTIREKYSKKSVEKHFGDIKSKIFELKSVNKTYIAKNKAENLLGEVERIEEGIAESLTRDFEKYLNDIQVDLNVTLPTIDFETIARNAEKESENEPKIIGYGRKPTSGFGGRVKRFFGKVFRNDSWGYEDDYSKPIYGPTSIDEKKRLQSYCNQLVAQFSSKLDDYIGRINDKIESTGSIVSNKVDALVLSQNNSINELVKQNDIAKIEQLHQKTIDELKLVDNYINQLKEI